MKRDELVEIVEIVEIVARGLCSHYYSQISAGSDHLERWEMLADFDTLNAVVDQNWSAWEYEAKAALTAIDAAGWAVVPVEVEATVRKPGANYSENVDAYVNAASPAAKQE